MRICFLAVTLTGVEYAFPVSRVPGDDGLGFISSEFTFFSFPFWWMSPLLAGKTTSSLAVGGCPCLQFPPVSQFVSPAGPVQVLVAVVWAKAEPGAATRAARSRNPGTKRSRVKRAEWTMAAASSLTVRGPERFDRAPAAGIPREWIRRS